MSINKQLQVNQLLHLELTDSGGETTRYPSRIEDLTDTGIVVAAPTKEGMPLGLGVGEIVIVWYWDNAAIYTFQSKVISKENEGIPTMLLQWPAKIEKVQNREYVRVQTSVPVQLTYHSEDGELETVSCRTRDISGGGVMLSIGKPLYVHKDSVVQIEFEVEGEEISIRGIIIWNDWELDNEGIEKNILGVKFTLISDIARQAIVKYVFQKQIELRRKGLL